MRQYKLVIFLYLVLAGTASYAADSTTCVALNKTVTSDVQENTTIVEFFSFYCPPCYFFSQKLGIDNAIRDSLPAGQKMVKYHAGFLGELGDELTRAWSVAMVAGLEERVEPLLFDAVMVSRTLKTPEDIRAVFVKAGLSAEEYDRMLTSQEVASMTEKQKRLFKEYGVTGTPTVFVKGRYRVENGAFQANSLEGFRDAYVAAVKGLLNDPVTVCTPEKK
ncbi:DsbA family protein [Salmonella enterica subsp. enterica serovar Kedougou]|uniref:Thiol:disulfide interchange protein n=3 Tax=Salmonella enterica TaxID=28901 RepID=A0A742L3Y7_SALER|nr:DsbA family protein [Salmonella enterica]EBW8251115.1 thiol:disulfide interchange protein [Salmonella enterica subsp. enterica serovar Typhimurium]ECC3408531.1 thiol:disulfide interchange protein [Salmonella enterica subsp. enterica]ECZ0079016.1 thioredoxin domain-containing protein [Salmonella enterica subsp. enterica serovar Essen]MCL9529456.1 DsbA family protein [Salmonella enterica subsp. enterica serovar Enteritidis]EAA3096400.1 thiol:disulfide interchange protein [Salmonella enterica 